MTPEESKKIILERVKTLSEEELDMGQVVCHGIMCEECFVRQELKIEYYHNTCNSILKRFTRKAKLAKLLEIKV